MVVVAPTKKAASVAAREIGAAAASLHALLADHGFRWGRDDAGAQLWTRLTAGDTDPVTGTRYDGPRHHPLDHGDRSSWMRGEPGTTRLISPPAVGHASECARWVGPRLGLPKRG